MTIARKVHQTFLNRGSCLAVLLTGVLQLEAYAQADQRRIDVCVDGGHSEVQNVGAGFQLVTQQNKKRLEMYEGVKIWDDRGWALVLPDSEKPRFNIYAQGHSEEFAEELAAEFSDRVNSLLHSGSLDEKS